MRKKDVWGSLREEIIQNIDVRKIYETWGIRFTGSVSSKGWEKCHAANRDDNNPSANVNLTNGIYKDFAGETLSIFDFAVKYGHAADWYEAHKILAKEAGIANKVPKKGKPDRAKDTLEIIETFSLASVKGLSIALKINIRVIPLTGAKIARYPKKSPEPQTVVAFPIFDPVTLLESPPESYVIQTGTGHPVLIYQGQGNPLKEEKRITIGTTGILNELALKHWDEAEIVYKTEGISDMLVLQDLIPEELRTKHIVITNAAGTDDGSPAWGLAPHCVGKQVVIIHDRDTPGQFGVSKDKTGGAARWVRAMVGKARSVKNLQLPFDMVETKGKDLKDWIHAGHTYEELLQLVAETPEEVTGRPPESTDDLPQESAELAILRRLNIGVVNCKQNSRTGTTIEMFNFSRNTTFFIRGISKYTYHDTLVDFSESAQTEIEENDAVTGPRLSMRQVKTAIAVEAGKKHEIRRRVGLGIWYLGDHRLVLVGAGEYLLMNGSLKKYKGPQNDSGDVVIQVGQAGEGWYDQAEIEKHMSDAKDPAWRTRFFNEFSGILRRWDNYTSGTVPDILAALALATWAQDVWSWRPWVSITGPSNCGKTTLFKFLHQYFGENISLLTGDTTAAGLRQSVDIHSKICMLDEFESNPERPKIIQWLKNAGAGGSSTRGTPGQTVVKSKVKIIPWMAAIEAQMDQESERNRYISIHMKDRTGMGFFEYPSPEQIKELRAKSLAVICQVYHRVLEIHKHLISSYKSELATRYIESWGLPVAVMTAVMGYTNEQAMDAMNTVMEIATDDLKENVISEDETLLQAIAGASVSVGSGAFMTVTELLSKASWGVSGSKESPSRHLGRVGIRKLPDDSLIGEKDRVEGTYVFLCHSMIRQKLFRGMSYSDVGIDQILMRCKGAIRKQQRIDGKCFRGINIPLSFLCSTTDEQDDFVPDGDK